MQRIGTRVTLAAVAAALATSDARTQCEPTWSSLDGHRGWATAAFAVYDEDGPGPLPPALFVGNGLGDIRGVARWDGWEASQVGDGPHEYYFGLYALEAVPEPLGMVPAGLFAGGDIEVAGGVAVNNIARWLAPDWHEVGAGLTSVRKVFVYDVVVFDEDGDGPLPPALFVGGRFEFAGGKPVEGIARWDGVEWSEVGGGLATAVAGTYPTVRALAIYDDGRGPALYAAGSFAYAGGKECWNIARWDGREWEPVGPGLATTVESLCAFDEDGPGPKPPALFAGGQFSRVRGGVHGTLMRIGRWDGREWTAVGGWSSSGGVEALAVWDPDGPGPQNASLYMGGLFGRLPDGTSCNRIARWDGERWHAVGGGVTSSSGIGPSVYGLGTFDEDGPGPNPGGLYVGGAFDFAGGVPARHIARWGCPLPPSRPCYADCDGSGTLEFFDFLCFQNLFATGDPQADCDQSGSLDFFDFLCFQNAFAAGCP